jgi:hypothetical protein
MPRRYHHPERLRTLLKSLLHASAIEQRIIGRELTRLFLEHHGYRVANRVCEPVHAANQHLGLASELQWSLAHRAGEYLEQSCIHG